MNMLIIVMFFLTELYFLLFIHSIIYETFHNVFEKLQVYKIYLLQTIWLENRNSQNNF